MNPVTRLVIDGKLVFPKIDEVLDTFDHGMLSRFRAHDKSSPYCWTLNVSKKNIMLAIAILRLKGFDVEYKLFKVGTMGLWVS